GVADQGGMIEELVEGFAAVFRVHGGIHEFAQVFDAGVGLGRVFVFEQLDVAGAVDEELQELSGVGGFARSAEGVVVVGGSFGRGVGLSVVRESVGREGDVGFWLSALRFLRGIFGIAEVE